MTILKPAVDAELRTQNVGRSLPAVDAELRTQNAVRSSIRLRRSPHLLGLAVVLMFMLVAAINYRSNAAWMLVFVLISATGLSALHARRNLAGVSVRPIGAPPVFAGEPILVGLIVASDQSVEAHALVLDVPSSGATRVDVMRVPALGSASATIELAARPRGPWTCDRVVIATAFPFGLIEARRVQAVEIKGLVYPKPAGRPLGQHCAPADGSSTTGDHPGGDEFNGHRRYQTGDSQHHVDWKAHARGRSLLVKDFIGAGGGVVWCEWEHTQGDDEQRLAQLALWILEAHRLAMSYGLRLPGVVIAPAAGEGHYHRCMRALTLHGFPTGGDP